MIPSGGFVKWNYNEGRQPTRQLNRHKKWMQIKRMNASRNRLGWLASLGNVYSRPRYPGRYCDTLGNKGLCFARLLHCSQSPVSFLFVCSKQRIYRRGHAQGPHFYCRIASRYRISGTAS